MVGRFFCRSFIEIWLKQVSRFLPLDHLSLSCEDQRLLCRFSSEDFLPTLKGGELIEGAQSNSGRDRFREYPQSDLSEMPSMLRVTIQL